MAGFHPRTFELLHEVQGREAAQNTFDRAQLARTPASARSKRAEALRERIGAYPAVSADLTRLIAFAEAVNRLYADHDAGLHDDGVTRLDCPACLGRASARQAAAEVLSQTPLATAFGAEPRDSKDGEQR